MNLFRNVLCNNIKMNAGLMFRSVLRNGRLYSLTKRTVPLHSKELSTMNDSLNHQIMGITKEIKDIKKICHNYNIEDPNLLKFQKAPLKYRWPFVVVLCISLSWGINVGLSYEHS